MKESNRVTPTPGGVKECIGGYGGDYIPFAKRSLTDPMQHIPSKIPANIAAVSEKARGLIHGVVDKGSDRAQDILTQPRVHPLLDDSFQKEKHYHQKEHKPLGKPAVQYAALPEYTKAKDYKFGRKSTHDEPVGTIMFPSPGSTNQEDVPTVHKMYLKSHHAYQPGEQKTRNYDWSRAPDGPNTTWGVRVEAKEDGEQARLAMSPPDEVVTKIVNDREQKVHERKYPELGVVHDPFKADREAVLPASHVFGVPPAQGVLKVSDILTSAIDTSKDWRSENAGYGSAPAAPLDTTDRFGIPTSKIQRAGLLKKVGDWEDERGAKAVINPSPRSIYTAEELAEFKRQMQT